MRKMTKIVLLFAVLFSVFAGKALAQNNKAIKLQPFEKGRVIKQQDIDFLNGISGVNGTRGKLQDVTLCNNKISVGCTLDESQAHCISENINTYRKSHKATKSVKGAGNRGDNTICYWETYCNAYGCYTVWVCY